MSSTSKFKKEIESKCFKFIWNGKPDKVNRNTLIGDFEKDGLKMIAVDSYLIFSKSSWVSRLTDSKFSNWKLIPLRCLNVFGKMAYFQYQHLHYIIRRKNVLLTNKDLLLFHIFVYRYALTLETTQFAKLQHIHMPHTIDH